MMSPLAIIDRFYAQDDEQRQLLLKHSWQVAELALRCAARHEELGVDRALVLRGALLHDIGVFATHAPSIHCNGREHYLMHGFVGASLLRAFGMEAEAGICERHTGAGLSAEAVSQAGLAIEVRDYFPETTEEKLVCYADKFFSKSHPDRVLTPEQAYQSLLRFGRDGAERFRQWHEMFA